MMDINQLLFVGTNKYGQAGIGEKHHNKTFNNPKSFAFPTFIKQISCGSHHSALLTIDGNVYTMGSNIHGALGANPSLNYSFSPILVEGLREVTKINCGPFHMCAISDGALYSWGKGIDGQLGHGNTKNMPRPTLIEALGNQVEQVSCGTNHTLVAVREEGHKVCYAFGNGIYGQLGTGQSRNSYIPVRVKLQQVESFAAGDNHSLFIVNGSVYACGDNSSGQLGTLFSKKFASEPTKIQFQGIDQNFVMVHAKKYSMALTQNGDVYVWGLKSGFGVPKKLKGSCSNLQIIQARIGSQKCFSLEAKGALHEWDIFKGKQFQNQWVCTSQIISNRRAILDFSAGEGYLLILGDIVKQIESNQSVPTNLSCFEDLEQSRNSLKLDQISLSRQHKSHCIVESQIQQMSRDSNYDKIKPQSHMEAIERRKSGQQLQKITKLKQKNEDSTQIQEIREGLRQCKDFNNVAELRNSFEKKEKSNVFKPIAIHQNPTHLLNNEIISQDTFDLVQSQSSSIQCEPSNFLKESIRQEGKQYNNQGLISDSILESEPQNNIHPAMMLKHKRKLDVAEDKENMMTTNIQKKGKQKKLDRVMEMLEKSHSISEKNIIESGLKEDQQESRLKQNEIIKTNRLLRVEIREKELKISQLQELLSRKQMEIEAQREVIKMLREKNNSNFASLQRN